MAPDDWPDVRRIYAEGIATADASLEREAPDWHHFDHSHRPDCRFVARPEPGGPILGWTALSAYSARRAYLGVAWESVYVGADARGHGVGRALLEALIPASEAAGLWPCSRASSSRTPRASRSTNGSGSSASARSGASGRTRSAAGGMSSYSSVVAR
jgi:L-amino acid N-acyltransferase YncA